MKINDVILRAAAKLVIFIILTFAIYLFVSGHDGPGGGFVGGLAVASGLILLLLSFDIETIEKGIPVDFKLVAAIGALIVISAGVASWVSGDSFLTMGLMYIPIPGGGEFKLSTVSIFEVGVALVVIGVVVTVISSISKDV